MFGLAILMLVSGEKIFEGHEIRKEIAMGEIQKFAISSASLYSDSKYEIRISYLGTQGCSMQVFWDCGPSNTRRLLDTEKLVFTTDNEGKIIEGCEFFKVQAMRNSRSINQEFAEKTVFYNIKLDQYNKVLHVPRSIIPFIIGAMVALILSGIMYNSFMHIHYGAKRVTSSSQSKDD